MYSITPQTSSSTTVFNPTTSKYYVTFAGTTIETTVTDKAATASDWVREITAVYGASPAVVGLDVEWRPHQISYMSNKSATLQLCINNKCLILQLFHMDEIPQPIKDFLLNPNFTYVGIEVEDDVKKLRNEYGLDCGRSMDVRAKAKALWPGRFRRPGLKDLASEVCGLNMRKPKDVCMSNWEARHLVKLKLSMDASMLLLLSRLGMSCFFRLISFIWLI